MKMGYFMRPKPRVKSWSAHAGSCHMNMTRFCFFKSPLQGSQVSLGFKSWWPNPVTMSKYVIYAYNWDILGPRDGDVLGRDGRIDFRKLPLGKLT